MSIRKLLCYSFLAGVLMSCGVLPQKNNFHTTTSSLAIGVIGDKKLSVYKTEFETASIPVYTDFIKLSSEKRSFTKTVFKEYEKAIKGKNISSRITYVDSLEIKPTYFEFVIEDKSLVIQALNKEENASVLNYVKHVPETKIVTGLRIVPTKEQEDKITTADALYMRTNQQKKQAVYLFKNERQIGVLELQDGMIFGYKTSSFCWGITSGEQIKLVTLLQEGENCTSKTLRDPSKLQKKLEENRFKF